MAAPAAVSPADAGRSPLLASNAHGSMLPPPSAATALSSGPHAASAASASLGSAALANTAPTAMGTHAGGRPSIPFMRPARTTPQKQLVQKVGDDGAAHAPETGDQDMAAKSMGRSGQVASASCLRCLGAKEVARAYSCGVLVGTPPCQTKYTLDTRGRAPLEETRPLRRGSPPSCSLAPGPQDPTCFGDMTSHVNITDSTSPRMSNPVSWRAIVVVKRRPRRQQCAVCVAAAGRARVSSQD